MINVNLLKSEFVKKGYSQGTFCAAINVAQSTFSRRLKKGYFKTDEAERIIKVLDLSNDTAKKIFYPQINLKS